MKQNFKNHLKFGILLFGVLIIVLACQKDTLEKEYDINETNIFKISTISINDFENKDKVYNRIREVKNNLKYVNQLYRTEYDSIYDFKVNEEDVILLEYEAYHWLTFGIKRDYETDYMENLVLKYDISHDIYEAFIAKYEITPEERETLKNGGVVQNLDQKTEIYSIKEYHIDETERTGIYVDKFGNCYVPTDILIFNDGSYSFIKDYVPCPDDGGSNSNGNDNGDGNNNGDGDGNNNDDGNDGSNFPNDTDPNNGGSNGNNNDGGDANLPDDDLDDTVATLPNPEITPLSAHEENCEKLLALNMTDSLSVNIIPKIDSLKTLTGLDKEYSISFRKNINYGETYSFSDPVGIREGQNSTSSPVRIGSTWFGQAHTHPVGNHYMFSWNDVNQLNNLYNGLSDYFDKKDVFLMNINHDGTVYALKVDDPDALDDAILNDLFNVEGNSMNEKVINLNIEIQNEFEEDEFNLEHIFLKRYEEFGISIYKAANTDLSNWNTDLSNWNKLELNPNLAGPNINEVPCN